MSNDDICEGRCGPHTNHQSHHMALQEALLSESSRGVNGASMHTDAGLATTLEVRYHDEASAQPCLHNLNDPLNRHVCENDSFVEVAPLEHHGRSDARVYYRSWCCAP